MAPDTDRPLMEVLRTMLLAELDSAARGHRPPRINMLDLVAMADLMLEMLERELGGPIPEDPPVEDGDLTLDVM